MAIKDHHFEATIWTDTIDDKSGWLFKLSSGGVPIKQSVLKEPLPTHSDALKEIDRVISQLVAREKDRYGR